MLIATILIVGLIFLYKEVVMRFKKLYLSILVIVAVLSGLSCFAEVSSSAKQNACRANMRTLASQQSIFFSDNDFYASTLDDLGIPNLSCPSGTISDGYEISGNEEEFRITCPLGHGYIDNNQAHFTDNAVNTPASSNPGNSNFLGNIGTGLLSLYLLLAGFMLFVTWRIFTKAGEPGWAALIPIYNSLVYFRVCGKPWWYLLLSFIPGVGFVFVILADIGLARNFGKSDGFAAGLIFLPVIFLSILAFDNSQFNLVEPIK